MGSQESKNSDADIVQNDTARITESGETARLNDQRQTVFRNVPSVETSQASSSRINKVTEAAIARITSSQNEMQEKNKDKLLIQIQTPPIKSPCSNIAIASEVRDGNDVQLRSRKKTRKQKLPLLKETTKCDEMSFKSQKIPPIKNDPPVPLMSLAQSFESPASRKESKTVKELFPIFKTMETPPSLGGQKDKMSSPSNSSSKISLTKNTKKTPPTLPLVDSKLPAKSNFLKETLPKLTSKSIEKALEAEELKMPSQSNPLKETLPKLKSKSIEKAVEAQELKMPPQLEPKNSPSFSLAQATNVTPNDLLSLLKCPVCLKPSLPPIFTCLTGHIICSTCKIEVTSCPTCHQSFTETRNILAEQLSQNILFSCKFQDEGCPLKALGEVVGDHEKGCKFRPIKCSIFPCKSRGSVGKIIKYGDYVHHLQTDHNAASAPIDKKMWRREMVVRKPDHLFKHGRKVPFLMECYNQKFLQCAQTDGQIIWTWVAILGTSEEAANYTAHLTLKPGDCDDKILKCDWTGPVHSVRDSSTQVLSSGFCMVTSEPCLQSFFYTENSTSFPIYFFGVKIKRKN